MKRIYLLLICILLGVGCSFAENVNDALYLKNGKIIYGVLLEQTPGVSLKFQARDGSILTFPMSEIQKIDQISDYNVNNSVAEKNNSRADKLGKNHGYKGFVEFGGAVGVGVNGDGIISFSTSHGYQFNPYVFLGAGIGFDYHFGWGIFFMPIYADVRAYVPYSRVSPIFGVKLGYSPVDGQGLYFNPNLGVNVKLKRSLALDFTVGFNLQRSGFFITDFYDYIEYDDNIMGVTFKVGLEF